jgi:hypothetical protein
MIFDPAHLTLAGLGSQEAASVLDDFKWLSIRNQGDPIRYGRNPVPKVRLLGHHINHFRFGMLAQTIATSQHGRENDAYCGAKEKTETGTAEER